MKVIDVKTKLIDGAKPPVYATTHAAGCDFYSIESGIIKADTIVGVRNVVRLKDGTTLPIDALSRSTIKEMLDSGLIEETTFEEECGVNDPHMFRLKQKKHPLIIRTGVYIELPSHVELEIRGRSGLGFKYSLVPHNGTIDSDYRGEIKLKIYNLGEEDFHFEAGERIAQGVIKEVLQANFILVDELSDTDRGVGGFESTGRK